MYLNLDRHYCRSVGIPNTVESEYCNKYKCYIRMYTSFFIAKQSDKTCSVKVQKTKIHLYFVRRAGAITGFHVKK
jgi:hypothetical protein